MKLLYIVLSQMNLTHKIMSHNLGNFPIVYTLYKNDISGNEHLSSETCHLVCLELGFIFQTLIQSHTRLRSQGLMRQINHVPFVYTVSYYCLAAKQ